MSVSTARKISNTIVMKARQKTPARPNSVDVHIQGVDEKSDRGAKDGDDGLFNGLVWRLSHPVGCWMRHLRCVGDGRSF